MTIFEPPVLAFLAGVVLSELYQWAAFWRKNADKPALTYWKMGLPHALGNLAGDVIVGVLWSYEGLDWLVLKAAEFVPGSGEWAASGIPFTPQMGILLGFGVDLFSDNLTYLVRKMGAAKAPWLLQQDQPLPAPQPTKGDS